MDEYLRFELCELCVKIFRILGSTCLQVVRVWDESQRVLLSCFSFKINRSMCSLSFKFIQHLLIGAAPFNESHLARQPYKIQWLSGMECRRKLIFPVLHSGCDPFCKNSLRFLIRNGPSSHRRKCAFDAKNSICVTKWHTTNITNIMILLYLFLYLSIKYFMSYFCILCG